MLIQHGVRSRGPGPAARSPPRQRRARMRGMARPGWGRAMIRLRVHGTPEERWHP